MTHMFRAAMLLIALVDGAAGGACRLGDHVDEYGRRNRTATASNSQNASMSISGGRVRLEQPEIVTRDRLQRRAASR